MDDTKLFLSFQLQDQSQSPIITEINQDLATIRNWCFDNQLLLNPDKTKLLVCGSKHMAAKIVNFQLSLLGKQLCPLEAARVHGVILGPINSKTMTSILKPKNPDLNIILTYNNMPLKT